MKRLLETRLAALLLAAFSSAAAGQVTAHRTLPLVCIPGETVQVEIAVEVDEASAPNGLIVVETLPSGWAFDDPDPAPAVAFDPVTGKVEWLFYGDGVTDTTIRYRGSGPEGASGQQTFDGVLQFNADGAPQEVAIAGDNACDAAAPCGNGTVDPGEECDGGVANGSDSFCCTSDCHFQLSGTTCRPAQGACDVAETCTGSSGGCPADAFAPASTECRPASDQCDAAEFCTGSSVTCPPDRQKPGGTTCDCVGDCDGNGSVAVNELVSGVNIALGNAPLGNCPAFDSNQSGGVEVNELVAGVNNALNGCASEPTPSPTPATDLCGNSLLEGTEQCDDGNNFGGDGCAANCSNETTLPLILKGPESQWFIQFTIFPVPIPLTGQEALTIGRPRGEEVQIANPDQVLLPDGSSLSSFAPGDVPVVIPANGVAFAPVLVPGLACACVGGREDADLFGPGNSGAGLFGCGDAGLDPVDYESVLDHDLDLSPGDCEAAGGSIERADPERPGLHAGVCNGPTVVTFTGGGPKGAGAIRTLTSLRIILGADCSNDPSSPEKGPDGEPCTDDDAVAPDVSDLTLTTGTAIGSILNANNVPGLSIATGSHCGALECDTTVTGAPVSCDELDSSLSGLSMVGVFQLLDGESTGDSVNTISFVAQ